MPKTRDAATNQAVAEPDKRRSPRRRLPFGRTAVLEIAGRAHLVALVDLSVTGAYLATRSAVPKGGSLRLRVRLPGTGELKLPCELVRNESGDDPAKGRRAGIAVRFVGVDDPVLKQLEGFVSDRGPRFGS
jgi:PilZ domain